MMVAMAMTVAMVLEGNGDDGRGDRGGDCTGGSPIRLLKSNVESMMGK